MKKLNLLTPGLALLVVFCIGIIAYQCKSAKVENFQRLEGNRLTQQRIEAKDAEIRTLAGQISTLRKKSEGRRGDDSLALNQKERAIATLTHKLAEKRIPIQVMADTIQPLRDYLILSDSLLAAKDTLIHEMTLRHDAQVVELDKIIDLQAQQIMAEQLKTKLWEEVAVKNEKDYNKERRRKGLWRSTAAILAGGVIFLTIQK